MVGYLILFLAVFIISMGLSVVIHPTMLKKLLKVFLEKKWLWPVSILRVIIGLIFVYGAGDTTSPNLIMGLGVLFILAGVIIPFLGSKRVEALAEWWMDQKDSMLRVWGFIALILGITLALATTPV